MFPRGTMDNEMKCAHPVTVSPSFATPSGVVRYSDLAIQVNCKRCPPCKVRRKNEWTARCLLEFQDHDYGVFLTLTYDQENVPEKLDYRDFQLFLKRLRKTSPIPIRFLACGEYGSKTGRPHWHAIMFGLDLSRFQSLQDVWQKGFVYTGDVTAKSIGYVVKYCLKDQRHEHSVVRQSNRPGLGFRCLERLGDQLQKAAPELREFPSTIRIGGRIYPLDTNARLAMQTGWMKAGGPELVIPMGIGGAINGSAARVKELVEGDPERGHAEQKAARIISDVLERRKL